MKMTIEASVEITKLVSALITKLAAETLDERLDDTERIVAVSMKELIDFDLSISPIEAGDYVIALHGIQEKLKRILQCNHSR